MTNSNLLFCYNCYNSKHIAKNCPFPVISYGIVCYVNNDSLNKYLMVERKHSFAFVEFLMGKYHISDIEYIQKLFNRMTLFERCCIAKYEFKTLWKKLWNSNGYTKKSLQREFWKASIKFYVLKVGYFHSVWKRWCQSQSLIDQCTENYKTPEWYFPKGKRVSKYEKPEDCAIREFREETNITNIYIDLSTKLFEEEHIAANGKMYKVYFFIAKYMKNDNDDDDENDEMMNSNHVHQQNRHFVQKHSEIGNIDWLTYDECLHKFRPYETEKLHLLNIVHKHCH